MRSLPPFRRFVVALLVSVSAVLGASTLPATAAEPDRPHVVFFGDSLLWEAQDVIRFFGGFREVDIDVHASGGTALCDWSHSIAGALADPGVDEVVIAFSGNNLTPCAKDGSGVSLQGKALGELYGHATELLMDAAPADKPVLWVTAPSNSGPNPNGDAVQRATVAAASAFPNAQIVEGGEHITPGGRWSATQPCIFFEPCEGPVTAGVQHNVVRAPDGAHFCPTPYVAGLTCDSYSSGALRYGLTILGPALQALGL